MSDSYGSLHRARYRRIRAEYGPSIARLHFDVFDTGSSFGPMVIPRIHGRLRHQPPERKIQMPKIHIPKISEIPKYEYEPLSTHDPLNFLTKKKKSIWELEE